MIISVIGDVHGNIDSLYTSIIRWQKEHQKTIDVILQVGDLGVYDPSKNHDIKSKILEKNPGEFNLLNFLKDKSLYESFFSPELKDDFSKIGAKLFFTRGNHDDKEYLSKLESKNPGSNIHQLNEHIFYISDSKPVVFYCEDGEYLAIASLGGIEKHSRPNSYEKDNSIAIDDDGLVQASAFQKKLDIFLTHMNPLYNNNLGSKDLLDLVDIIQPKYYFFGHLNKNHSKFKVKNTNVVGLKEIKPMKEINLAHYNPVEEGSMYVLEKKSGELKSIDESQIKFGENYSHD